MANKTQILVELLLQARDEISADMAKSVSAVKEAGEAFKKMGAESTKALDEAGKAISKIKVPASVARALDDTKKKIVDLAPAARAASVATQDAFNPMASMFTSIKASLVGLAAGFTVGAVVSGIKQIVNELDNLRDEAITLAIPVDQLAGLKFAAEQSGGGVENLTTAVRSLSNQIDAAISGNDTAAKSFQRLGLSAAELARIPVADALLKTFDAVKAMAPGVERNAAAMDILGRSYQSLLPLINEGSAGVRSLMEEQAGLNPVTQASADKADNLNDALGRAKEGIKGFVNVVLIESGILEKFTALMNEAAESARRMQIDTRAVELAIGDKRREQRVLDETDPNSPEGIVRRWNEARVQKKAIMVAWAREQLKAFAPGPITGVPDASGTFAKSALVYEDAFGQALRKKNEAEATASASRIESAARSAASRAESEAKAAANRIKQIQDEALTYIANVREKDLEKTVAGLRILEAEHIAKYANIGLAAADLEKLKQAVAAETNGKIKELQADAFKAYMEDEKKAYDATVKRHEAQLKAAQDTLESTERSISRTTELANLRAQIDADLGRTGAGATEARAHQIAMDDLAARRAAIMQSEAGIPAGAVGDAQRLANMEAMRVIQHDSTMETEKHNAAMIRLGTSTQSWAAGAATAFQAWREQHSAFNTASQAMTQAIDGISSATSNFVMGIVTGAKKGKDAFKEFTAGLIKMLGEILIKALMTAAVMALIGLVVPGASAAIMIPSMLNPATTNAGPANDGLMGPFKSLGGSKSASIMPMPGGRPAMGGGSDKGGGGQVVNVYNINAIEPQTFASYLQSRDSKDVLSGQIAQNLRGNAGVRGAARS